MKKNFDKMAFYDPRIKKLTRVSKTSFYLFLVKYFHPESCEIILDFLKIEPHTR